MPILLCFLVTVYTSQKEGEKNPFITTEGSNRHHLFEGVYEWLLFFCQSWMHQWQRLRFILLSIFLAVIPSQMLASTTTDTGSGVVNPLHGMTKPSKINVQPSKQRLKFEYVFDIGGEPGFATIQDQDGFIWFSSFFNGMVRYDGSGTKKIQEGPNGLTNDFVTQLLEDSQGLIWIGTNSGLNLYDKNTNTFTHFRKDEHNPQKGLTNDTFNLSANTIVEDRHGTMWFGTQSGLSRFERKKGTFKHYLHNPDNFNSLSDNDIHCVFEDRQGMLWISTKKHGVNLLNPMTDQITRFRHDSTDPESLPDDEITAIVEDNQGYLWFSSRDNGLIRYERKSGKFEHYVHQTNDSSTLPKMSIWDMELLRDGRIAIVPSTSEVGLILFNPVDGQYDQFLSNPGDPYGITTNMINDVFEDRDGTLWIIHNNGKVDKHDPKEHRFTLYRHNDSNPDSIASNAPIPIYEDKSGTIWIGHFGAGLDRYNPDSDSFSHFKPDSNNLTSLPHGYPAGFFEDDRNNFIISTAEGMVLFDGVAGLVRKRLTDDTWFYTIIQDPDDEDILWAVGWEQSFNRYHLKSGERTVFRHNPNDPRSFSAVTAIRMILDHDDPDKLWIATWGGGLELFNRKTEHFTHFKYVQNDVTTVSSNTVYDVYEDSHGRFWVCTDRGLNRFDKRSGQFHRIGTKQGFAAKIVHNVLEDNQGYLWFGTNIGLVKFDPTNEKVLKIYTHEDGLHSHDFFPTARGKTRSGQLWFGGFNGVNSFYPNQLKDNLEPAQVFLTAIHQNSQLIQTTTAFERLKTLHLDWNNNSFDFEYVVLNYTHSLKNRYQYYLEGHDRDWYNAETHRLGRYANLPGGSYVLRIRGSNNDGIWSRPDQEVQLYITVDYPPWQRWWALIIYLVLAITLLQLFLKWRLRASEAQKQELSRLVDDRTEALRHQSNLLEAVMGSIRQGLVAYDKKLMLIISNQRYREIRDVPEIYATPGSSFLEWVRFDVERGEFSENDPEARMQEKIAKARHFVHHHFERTRPDGSIVEVEGGPLPRSLSVLSLRH